jgi:hypothetical protein
MMALPARTSANISMSQALQAAMFCRNLMKLMVSWPVIFLELNAPKPRKASPLMLAASQCRWAFFMVSQKNFFFWRMASMDSIKHAGNRLAKVQMILSTSLSKSSKSAFS